MNRWCRPRRWIFFLMGLALLQGGPRADAELKPDETLLLFPTYGREEGEEEGWLIEVHGWIFEPESSQILEPLLRRGLELADDTWTAQERRIWSERVAWLIADSERGKSVRIHVGGRQHLLGPSQANGHVRATLKIPRNQALPPPSQPARQGGASVLTLQADLDDTGRKIDGTVLLVPRHGVSIVSDIDDTIKISQVRDRAALLRNTFLRPYQPVAGMAGLYRDWQTNSGAVFHYVSASPWALIRPLETFLRGERFPDGTLHLQDARIKDGSVLQLLTDHDDYKLEVIGRIVAQFPGRTFVLVGDSGELDPEIYGELTRRFPEQVRMVLIRDVTGEGAQSGRYERAFRGVAREGWRLFGEGTELKGRDLGRWLSK